MRHQHEMEVWKETKLAPGTILMPGVISHATNIVEHPELIARRLVDWAGIVGPENVGGRRRLWHERTGAYRNWLDEARSACRRGGSRDENLVALTGNRFVSATVFRPGSRPRGSKGRRQRNRARQYPPGSRERGSTLPAALRGC